MFGSNIYETMESSYTEGLAVGTDRVMSDLNELMYDTERFQTVEERAVIRRVYGILSEMHPEKL